MVVHGVKACFVLIISPQAVRRMTYNEGMFINDSLAVMRDVLKKLMTAIA